MKTLIISSSYVETEFRRKEVLLSTRLMRRLNPDTDILLVDSASPFNPAFFAPDVNVHIRQEENIGHPTVGGDGWGRDLCSGITYAAEKGYDWVVFIESDMMLFRSIAPIVDKLQRVGCFAATPISFKYQWIETGIMFLYVPMLIATKFVERYGWPSHRAPFYCEPHCEKLLADELLILPLRGARDDEKTLSPSNLSGRFAFGIDYLTHARDFVTYRAALKMNGLEDVIEGVDGGTAGWRYVG